MHVLEGAVPALRGVIDEIPSLLANMGAQDQSDGGAPQVMRNALQRYAKDVTAIYGAPLNAEDLAARGIPTVEQCEGHGTVEARRAAFGSLTDALVEELKFTPKPEVLAACRTEALVEAQFLAAGSMATVEQAVDGSSGSNSVSYLESRTYNCYAADRELHYGAHRRRVGMGRSPSLITAGPSRREGHWRTKGRRD